MKQFVAQFFAVKYAVIEAPSVQDAERTARAIALRDGLKLHRIDEQHAEEIVLQKPKEETCSTDSSAP